MKLSIAVPVVGLALPLIAAFTNCAAIADYAIQHQSYHRSTPIKESGPFASSFPSIGSGQEEAIREWFLDTLPPGIAKRDAKTILSKSFSKDLTRGRAVAIDKVRSMVGGGTTTVQLTFDRDGRFESVEVVQQYDTIMGPSSR